MTAARNVTKSTSSRATRTNSTSATRQPTNVEPSPRSDPPTPQNKPDEPDLVTLLARLDRRLEALETPDSASSSNWDQRLTTQLQELDTTTTTAVK